MDREIIKEFVKAIHEFGDNSYLKAVLLYNISPVISGEKPASIISFSKAGRDLKQLWQLNKENMCNEIGVNYFEIKHSSNYITVLFYNRSSLMKLLADKKVCEFLKKFGYRNIDNLNNVLLQVRDKYSGSIPHEVGVLLGIPIEDVKGFMEGESNKCLFTGYWKVYSQEQKARYIFSAIDKVRERTIYDIINWKRSN